MSPVIRIGPWCSRCGQRPALIELGICRCCELLLQAFGHGPAIPGPRNPPMSRFDVLVELGGAHPADSPEFDRDLQQWMGRR